MNRFRDLEEEVFVGKDRQEVSGDASDFRQKVRARGGKVLTWEIARWDPEIELFKVTVRYKEYRHTS